MHFFMKTFAAAAIAFVPFASPSYAELDEREIPLVRTAASLDEALLSTLHAANLAEIDLGKLALQKSRDSRVRAFATEMIRDHRNANHALMQFASANQLRLFQLSSLGAGGRNEMQGQRLLKRKLQGLFGARFDRQYAAAMKRGHDKVVLRIERTIPKLSTRVIRQFARQQLPTLRKHKRHAAHLSQLLNND